MDAMKDGVAAQYRAALAMLQDAVKRCPSRLWNDRGHNPPFWRIAYHTLFYTDLYLCGSVEDFSPREIHTDNDESLDPSLPGRARPQSKVDLSAYGADLAATVAERLDALDPDGPSGMPWLPFTKAELQLYNLRHIHHHVGQLSILLREGGGGEIDWVCAG